jgi:hypothetical protein
VGKYLGTPPLWLLHELHDSQVLDVGQTTTFQAP